jgi:hypothetical protein
LLSFDLGRSTWVSRTGGGRIDKYLTTFEGSVLSKLKSEIDPVHSEKLQNDVISLATDKIEQMVLAMFTNTKAIFN